MLTICSPQLGLSLESNSGGEVYDREVIIKLCQEDVSIHALIPKGRTYPQLDNLIVKHTFLRSIIPPHFFNFFVFPYLLNTYLFHHFDLLRVHNPYFVGPAACLFKYMYPQVPLVLSHLHLESGFNFVIDKPLIKFYDHVITISQSTKNEIHQLLNYPLSKITVAYPGVDQRFKQGVKSQELISQYHLENKLVLLFLGGLKPRKNLFFLLHLLKSLNQSQVVLMFAGTGPLLAKLKQKAESLNLQSQVIFTGFIKEKDKVKYYRLADILLLPSLKEGFGMTITEAAACAIPAIGADHYSIKEIIINRKTGFLAKPDDLKNWTKLTLQLIKSTALRQQLGQAAQKRVKSYYSWDKNIQTQLTVFNQLIKKL